MYLIYAAFFSEKYNYKKMKYYNFVDRSSFEPRVRCGNASTTNDGCASLNGGDLFFFFLNDQDGDSDQNTVLIFRLYMWHIFNSELYKTISDETNKQALFMKTLRYYYLPFARNIQKWVYTAYCWRLLLEIPINAKTLLCNLSWYIRNGITEEVNVF